MNELGALSCICDSNADTLANFQKEYPAVTVCSEFAELLEHPDVKAVVIAPPALAIMDRPKRRSWQESMFFVGAGSVVTSDVPDTALVMGNPARIKGWMCPAAIKLTIREIARVAEKKSPQRLPMTKSASINRRSIPNDSLY